ncbi:hypothetical protein KH5_02160 [Urechidicola sp. KH5]
MSCQSIKCQNKIYTLEAIQLEASADIAKEILNASFKEMPKNNHFGTKSGSYWLKLKVNNTSSEYAQYVLRVPTHNIGWVHLYTKKESVLELLDKSRAYSNNLPHVKGNRFPSFLLEIDPKTTNTYYLQTTFEKEPNFPISIELENDYYVSREKEKIIESLYYGFLFAVIVFNLFFYVRFSDKVYLYYTLFLLSYNITSLTYDGYFRGIPYLNIEAFNHVAMQITMLLFSYKFLDLNTHYPQFKKFAYVCIASVSAVAILYMVTKNQFFFGMIDFIDMVCFTAVWVLAIKLISKISYAKFYVLGYMVLLVSAFYLTFSYNYGWFPVSADGLTLKIGGGFDMLIFTYAITYRMDIISQKQRDIILELKSYIKKSQIETQKNTPDSNPLYFLLKVNKFSNDIFTIREIEILERILDGYTNNDIAQQLFISPNTVKYHIKNIYKKLGVHNRKETTEKLKSYMH